MTRLWPTIGVTNTVYEHPDITTLEEPMSYYGPADPYSRQPGPYQGGSYGWNPQGNHPGQGNYPPPGGFSYMPVPQPGSLPLRPLGLADYFTSMFATLRKSPGLFFGAALIFGSIAALLSATGEFFLTRTLTGNAMDPYAQLNSFVSQTLIWSALATFVSQTVLILGQTFSWGMYSTMVARGAVGMKTSLGQGFRLLSGQWGRIILLFLLVAAGMVVLTLIFVLLLGVIAGMFSNADSNNPSAVIAVILALMVAMAIPAIIGVFFIVRWCLVVPAIVIENIGVFAALRRSWHLTRGHFWRTLGIALLFGIILFTVSLVILTPLSFVSAFVLASLGTEAQLNTGMLLLNVVISAVSSLIGFIITNMGLLVTIFFYFDYRFRDEGLGLEFQQIAAQQATGSTTDRFDTSVDRQPDASDQTNDLIPGRHSAGLQQPGPYGPWSQGYQSPQGPPNPAGPYR